MTLAPLINAPLAIQIHAVAALALVPLTAVQFWRRKGGIHHRALGWAWVVLMAIAAVSSFWIHSIRLVGPFSPIHILSIITIAGLFGAIRARRAGHIAEHRRTMMMITAGWFIAGAFAFLPGRVMFQMVAGG